MKQRIRILGLLAMLAVSPALGGCGTILTGVLGYVMGQEEDEYEYEPGPTGPAVSSVQPSRGGLAGGTFVHVYGVNFAGGCTVRFGLTAATGVTFLSSNHVTCLTPASTVQGAVDVTVTNPGGSAGGLGGGYTYTNWWYDAWGFRRPVTVTNGMASALTDFQAKVTVAYDSDMQSDFGDLRFTCLSGTDESPVAFWLESSTAGTTADFWVRVPSIPNSGAANLFAYYGNALAEDASDFDATFTKIPSLTGIAGLWHFDEGMGFAATDWSGNVNQGWLGPFNAPNGWLASDGGAWGTRQDAGFSQGSALDFDGIDDFVDCGNAASLDVSTAFTVEAWVRGNTARISGGTQVVASKWGLTDGFWDKSRWAYYDAEVNSPNYPGGVYGGAAFDGQYIYFPGHYNTNYYGQILRLDTRGGFSDSASWDTYDPATALGHNPGGFIGAVFDGKYVYFVPFTKPGGHTSEVVRYDTQLGFDQTSSWTSFEPAVTHGARWTSKTGMTASTYGAGTVEVNGTIYVIGGNTGSVTVSTVHAYNPATDAWSAPAPPSMVTPRENFGCAVIGSKVYAIGGDNGGPIANVEVLDAASPAAWMALTPIPTPLRYHSAAAVNGKIYVFGGHDGVVYNPATYVFDPSQGAGGTWSTAAAPPSLRQSHRCAVVNGKIYVIGGFDGGYLGTVEEYDPASNLWRTRNPMPTALEHFLCAEISGRIYVIGGYNGGQSYLVYQYDPSVDAWAAMSSMPSARSSLFGAVSGGRIYAIGGYNAGPLNTNEEYTPANEGLGDNPTGFFGGVFDGRYVYFVPYANTSYHGEVMRYDTQAAFDSIASWAVFRLDASSVGTQGEGFAGGVFDGRYVYFVPYYSDAGSYHGEVARYDTNGDFQSPGSWAAYDPGSEGLDAATGYDLDGFRGCTFDGRYVYFVPHYNGMGRHGAVMRFDTRGDFQSLSSWSAFDAGYGTDGTNGLDALLGFKLDGFHDACFDGRYVYFSPYYNDNYFGQVLRYDTCGSFESVDSWTAIDPGAAWFDTPGPPVVDLDGFNGIVSDGRFLYFVPYHSGAPKNYHAQVLRYDTTGGESSFRLDWTSGARSSSLGGSPAGLGGVVDTDTGLFSVFSQSEPSNCEWHHVALSFDGSALNLYFDGALSATAAATGTVRTSAARFEIGSFDGGSAFLSGAVDEVRYYSRALGLAEILANSQRRVFASTDPSAVVGAEEQR